MKKIIFPSTDLYMGIVHPEKIIPIGLAERGTHAESVLIKTNSKEATLTILDDSHAKSTIHLAFHENSTKIGKYKTTVIGGEYENLIITDHHNIINENSTITPISANVLNTIREACEHDDSYYYHGSFMPDNDYIGFDHLSFPNGNPFVQVDMEMDENNLIRGMTIVPLYMKED